MVYPDKQVSFWFNQHVTLQVIKVLNQRRVNGQISKFGWRLATTSQIS